jgi:hypothetical protein
MYPIGTTPGEIDGGAIHQYNEDLCEGQAHALGGACKSVLNACHFSNNRLCLHSHRQHEECQQSQANFNIQARQQKFGGGFADF